MTDEERFEEVKSDWESHDDWRFADRDAERKYFYLAGLAEGRRQSAEIADSYHHGGTCQITNRCRPCVIAAAIRGRMNHE